MVYVMDFETLFASLPSDGWLDREEAELLLYAAKQTIGTILEVGCYYGRSTIVLASLGRPIICVDPFSNFNTEDPSGDKIEAGFLSNLKERGITNVSLVRKKIEEWMPTSVGFAYLDGDHTYLGTVSQIKTAISCRASYVCIHDYGKRGDGRKIKEAVDRSSHLKILRNVGKLVFCRVVECTS